MKTPTTQEGFMAALLKNANTLFQRECMNADSLFQSIIARSPPTLVSILYQLVVEKRDRQYFMAKADEVSWLPFVQSQEEGQQGVFQAAANV
jgi:hypothetical protein